MGSIEAMQKNWREGSHLTIWTKTMNTKHTLPWQTVLTAPDSFHRVHSWDQIFKNNHYDAYDLKKVSHVPSKHYPNTQEAGGGRPENQAPPMALAIH